MKKFIAFASGIHLDAVRCCGVAVLLSACGAGVSDPVNRIQSQTAAELITGTPQSAANHAAATPDTAVAAPATATATQNAAAATPAAAQGTRASGAAANIEPAYDSKRQAAGTTGFSDQAETPVPAAQEIAATACETGPCQH